jgi:hypothetical protein
VLDRIDGNSVRVVLAEDSRSFARGLMAQELASFRCRPAPASLRVVGAFCKLPFGGPSTFRGSGERIGHSDYRMVLPTGFNLMLPFDGLNEIGSASITSRLVAQLA